MNWDFDMRSGCDGRPSKANWKVKKSGRVHLIREDGITTLCGVNLKITSGEYISEDVDCGACFISFGAKERREQLSREFEIQNQQRNRQIEEEQKRWWQKYNDYLLSPEWAERRSAVIQRANGICEGCRKAPATQAHHITYKHVFHEPLFELVAVCDACHHQITNIDRKRDGEE